MQSPQPGILAPIPGFGRYLEFSAIPDRDPGQVLNDLAPTVTGDGMVVGFGAGLVRGLDARIDGLEPFPSLAGPNCVIPATQSDLWIWLRGQDSVDIAARARAVRRRLEPAFRPVLAINGFKYGSGLDLSGYEDGTENPKDEAAYAAAIAAGAGPGLDGGSFVAVQQWVHDLDYFNSFGRDVCDNIIGRRLSDNEELDDAPASAHVKRTAQESFEPEAFLIRRSMPWQEADREGLVFVAFGKSTAAFRAQLDRMIGVEDGIIDGLFHFSRPVTGSYFWCPPMAETGLDLSQLKI